ncbi:NEL-type E3 ubiquitin ligase domain-containing protein [Enterobacter ludwigii]|uniref:NEL-type E3 ubiquitin ligase domain-containing protein n=1 Tax=Enterobacter TaxID=547 RepID=UPI0029415E92|nr:E3 ubiquitin--protein ligase [Citrobacter amalonaticus]
MPFQVGNGCLPAAISNSRINQIARTDTSPDVSVWEKIKAFFCSTNKPEALELIRQICHPPAGTTLEQVAGRFEQLRTLAYAGFEENVQSGRHGENHFCVLDENSREMLSVTLDDAGKYTVKCQGHREIHHLIPDTEPGEEYAEHTEGASGTLRAEHAATTAPQDYEAVWSVWEKAAPAGESPHRAVAVREMLKCLHNGRTNLYLDNLDLTSLPYLPEGLQQLSVVNNQLTSLPPLPSGLQRMYVRNNRLISLPRLPAGLVTLNVGGNQLTSLPPLPSGLQIMYVRNNRLTSLPVLPAGLRDLIASGNRLSSLPESITSLSPGARVSISNNPLSARTRQDLEAVTSAPGYSGPTIHFSMVGPSAPREPRPLYLAVADWLPPTKKGEPAPADSWQSSGQENDAASFSAFLDRLSETENCKKDPGFKSQISSWLTQLAEDDELRAKTFTMATEATSSCEDRVTIALNQMKNVQQVHDAEKGKYDNNLPVLVSKAREMFRLEKLEQIARDKVITLRFVDEIEVYLGYQNKLKEALGLSSVSAEMRFFYVSGVTDSDLQAAELQVKTAENSQFREWILQWAPLRSVLERAYPEDWEALVEKKISDYDNTFRMLSDTELEPAGLAGNADAERAVGARALESAEQAFHAGLRPLADRMLGGHLKARWS